MLKCELFSKINTANTLEINKTTTEFSRSSPACKSFQTSLELSKASIQTSTNETDGHFTSNFDHRLKRSPTSNNEPLQQSFTDSIVHNHIRVKQYAELKPYLYESEKGANEEQGAREETIRIPK